MRSLSRYYDSLKSVKGILLLVRWIVLVGVLYESRLHFPGVTMDSNAIATVVGIIAVLTFMGMLVPKEWFGRSAPVLTVAADIAFVTAVVYFSDGLQSPFFPLYYLTVLSAAAASGMLGAVLSALVITILVLLNEVAAANWSLSEGLVLVAILQDAPYLILLAIIAGALRERIRSLARSTAKLQADHDAYDRELSIAQEVHQAMLPLHTPEIDGLEIATYYKPAREIGGDFYDFYPVEENCLGVAIVDIAGKGVPAALLVSSAKYALREYYSDDHNAMMQKINRHLQSVTTDYTFVTMVYGVLNVQTRRFSYANAGHMPPMVVKPDREVVLYQHVDPPLGMMTYEHYCETVIQLEPGDTLVLYTDGLTDAMASGAEGIDELKKVLSEIKCDDVECWGDEILKQIAQPRHVDDTTLVIVRIK